MFTRRRFVVPNYTGNPEDDYRNLAKAISDHLQSLESKQSLTLDSATGLDNTPVGANAASSGAFTSLAASGTVSGAGFNVFLPASSYTAADVLAKVKTVDGSGSGLDADLLDGIDSSSFLLASGYTAADVLTKIKTVDGSGSGLDADLLDGFDTSQAATASTVAVRNSSGYLFAAYLNQNSASAENPAIGAVFVENSGADGYLRKSSLASLMSQLVTTFNGSATPTAGSGAFTTVIAAVTTEHFLGAHFYLVKVTVTITTNGTAGTLINVPLPITASQESVFAGRCAAVSGKQVQGIIAAGTSTLTILAYDNTYPGASGERITLSGIVYV